jgi:WW domain
MGVEVHAMSAPSGSPDVVPAAYSEQDARDREANIQRRYQIQREEYQRHQQQQLLQQQQEQQMYIAAPHDRDPRHVRQHVAPGNGRQHDYEHDPAAPPIDMPVIVGSGRSNHSLGSNGGYVSVPASDDGGCNGAAVAAAPTPAVVPADEWVAVRDSGSDRFYYANSATGESLWLPPDWERFVEQDGRAFFVDHGAQTTQRDFPAHQARMYRDSVSSGALGPTA